MVRAQWLVL
ncbi:hypothetical protein YPPY06_0409, partial [Yersinia pestis PY-06]